MIKVKICGITNEQDALWAVNLGADFIGINFWSGSPRHVSVAQGAKIVQKVPAFCRPVGVFVNEEAANLSKILKKTGLTMVQLHGQETPEVCQALKSQGVSVIKAVRVTDDASLEAAKAYAGAVDYLLLDAGTDEQPGGTGQTVSWETAAKASGLGIPFFLAGGLTPENVGQAAAKVKPQGVDVASGVEKSPKRKDYEKMKDFITKARRS